MQGQGWCISDEICRAGPSDRPFEEQHTRFSVSVVLSGTFAYRSARGRALLSPGSILLGPQSAQFSCSHEHTRGDRCICFYFDQAWIENVVSETPGLRSTSISHICIPPAQSLAPLIADVQAVADGLDGVAGEELAFRMAAVALTFSPGEQALPYATPADEKRIAAVVSRLDEEISGPLSLDSLASIAGMSRYHFLRVFQRVTGQTPWRFILSRRLTLAGHQLATGNGTVLNAAVASGFTDLSEFTRQFRRYFGVTPGIYRGRITRGVPRVGSPRRNGIPSRE